MKFKVDAELRYEVKQRGTLLLCIHAYESPRQILSEESFLVTEGVRCDFFPLASGQHRYVRIDTQAVVDLAINYSVFVETDPDSLRVIEIGEVPISDLSPEALPFLFPSRYCQSDEIGSLAQELFGHVAGPLGKAKAISDWIFENVSYTVGASDPTTTALDILETRQGVCRDFAHLGIAFCRALSIPARYFSGYAAHMQPPDFHACFEVFVGDRWFLFDPTRLSHPRGMARIATGLDASDTAVATIFGDIQLTRSAVSCVTADGADLPPEDLEGQAIQLKG
ncbi:transglutaminase-like domain-containing protein [Roseibacillus ishigakijimensis]|uniref:Transglutaminase family protein n=1 Tax=Roseibacillus ishigakijimensis TaxID=454146 RepID=A0A934RMX6_9BACT|nr:transglutaminase family protein [Roseibacillus ishigakijimensis]MBK1833753.1 transglutaminase family protein [Roseibacillus ishigakijimensis]